MELGIGISNVGLCISWENSSKLYGAMQYGIDLTKPSQLSAADMEMLKTILDSYAGLFISGLHDLSRISEWEDIVISYPLGMDLLEYAALKSLFQRMGIRVRRFINGGMARGLFVWIGIL